MKLVYRSSLVGGSTTLITRCGVLSWIRTRQPRNDVSHVTLHELASQILKTCDSSRVTEWSGEVNLNLDVVLSR
jgi:nucleolar pre-ribosomal-associated protein 1